MRSLDRIRRTRDQLRPLYGGDLRRLIILLVVSVTAGFAEATVLALIAAIAAAMVVDEDGLDTALGSLGLELDIGTALTIALAVAGLRLALQVVIAWLPAAISADVQGELRRNLIAAFAAASWPVQSEDREGLFQELMTSQVLQTTLVVMQVIIGLSGSAMFLALVVAAFILSPIAALIILAAAFALFFALRPLARLGRAAARNLSQANVAHAFGVGESVRLAEEAQVFGTKQAVRERVGDLIDATRYAFFRFQLMGGLVRSVYQGLVILLIVIGLSVIYFSNLGNLAALGAVVLMLVRASSYAQQFQSGFQALNQLIPYLERIQTAINRYTTSASSGGHRTLSRIETLAFDRVGFSYRRGNLILHDISFEVHGGEAIGVAGPSGAGKSTLVQILLCLRQPQSGNYLVNGQPANSFRTEDWHRQVAYVAQEPRILHTTVAENIRFFREIGEADVRRAAMLAHIHDDIMQLPEGYDTVIGPLADAVSGGQRQRICLARALAAEPGVLVLDEPTSALDMASESAVQASLAELHGHVTLFIIAHRMSTLSDSDRVLVLVDGCIEAFDHPSGLARTSNYYRSAVDIGTNG